MGPVIAIGLVLLACAWLLGSRSASALLFGVVLAFGGAGMWLLWAENEYRGLDSCPYGVPNHGHPVLVGIALSVAPGIVLILIRRNRDPWGWLVTFAGATTLIAAAVISIVAFLLGAGLRCQD